MSLRRASPGPWIIALLCLPALPGRGEAEPRAGERGESPAAAALAHQLVQTLSAAQPEAPVGLFLRGDSPELARAVQTLLAAELTARGLSTIAIDAPGAEAAEAAARTAGARSLVRLTIALENGLLASRGDLLGTRVNFWSGADRTRPALPAAALTESVEADASALALAAVAVAPAPKLALAAGPLELVGGLFARLPAAPAAIASGDLDADGKHEVAVLTDDEVLVYSPDGKLLARHEHRSLASAEAPCREPFGSIAIQPGSARILYLSAKRARGEALLFDRVAGLKPVGSLDEVPLGFSGEAALVGQLVRGTNTFAAEIGLGGRPPIRLGAPFTSASARAGGFLFVSPDGAATFWRAGQAGNLRGQGAGAGSALADLTGEGQLALVTTSTRHSCDPDELRVLPIASLEALWSKGAPVDLGAAAAAWQGPSLRGRVLSIAAADLDGDKADELVLGVWLPDGGGELQVFRRATP